MSKEEVIKARREYSGPAFLSAAFRPFFFAASIWAVLSIAIWLDVLLGDSSAVNIGLVWHIHEMVFGFAAAAVAGFILTAVPNWTGRLPVRGLPLAGLAMLWLMGRLAMLAYGFLGVAYIAWIDSLFLFVLAFVVAREIIMGKNKRNIIVAIFIFAFAVANLLMHLELQSIGNFGGHGWRLGLGVLVALLALIGGRITPSFTRNWLAKRGEKNLPGQPGALDKFVLLLTIIAILFWVVLPDFYLSGILLIFAGLGQGIRLTRWRGLACLREPIVFVLHIGFCWIALGLVLLGASIVWQILPASTAIHALTIGAVGTMISAVTSRASLGHSGRIIKAGKLLSFVYLLISAAAVLRISNVFTSGVYITIMAGLFWVLAFGLFVLLFSRLWFSPRK